MKRHYYSASIADFQRTPPIEILGELVTNSEFAIEATERSAWQEEIRILKEVLSKREGTVYFEYSIPRMGKRIDVIVLSGPVIFVLEFKIGEREFTSYALSQVWDYALDLKNFHETSRDYLIAPVLIATKADSAAPLISATRHDDKVLSPIRCNEEGLTQVLERVLGFAEGALIDSVNWESGRYSPTPTIIEAAMALYNNHAVTDISRNDAAAINLGVTSNAISEIIEAARTHSFKAICFVTGVPGAGKTLVG